MSTNLKKELISSIDKFLLPMSFIRKNDNWYYYINNIIRIINLQKSVYWSEFFINIWIFFVELDKNNLYPKYNDWHIWTRIEMITKNERQINILLNCLKFDNLDSLKDKKFYDLYKSITEILMPIIETNQTVNSIKNLIITSNEEKINWWKTKFMVKGPGKDYLGI